MSERETSARPVRLPAWALLFWAAAGCAGPVERPPHLERSTQGIRVASIARSMEGVAYRFGGASPDGFDCSGLVVYSFARAGRLGLPHSVRRLDRLARPVSIEALRPGDLLFFALSGRKISHVGIYLGDERFIHAPSSGKAVEIVGFSHVYWGPRIQRAGRL